MRKLIESKWWLLLIVLVLTGYFLNFLDLDVVKNDNVWQEYLNEKYEKKYNEFKDLDLDLSEFEEELKEFEPSENQDNSYGWDYFYIDSLNVLVPILVVIFGYSCLLLIFFLFHSNYNIISYKYILKASTIAYFIFYIPEIISNIYFIVFKRNYKIEDVKQFSSAFYTSTYFNKDKLPSWLWAVITDFQFIYIVFPFLVAVCLKFRYKDFSLSLLAGYCYAAYLIAFIFYEILLWYLFGF